MLLSRNQFFLLLLVVFLAPFYGPRFIWLAHSRTATGKVWFIGHTLELQGDISTHRVILFKVGRDYYFFNAAGHLKVGDPVPVRYNKTHPPDARINTAFGMWADLWVNSLLPELLLLILFITPRRFDPLIPWKARIRLGIKPLIKIIPHDPDSKH